MNGRQEKEAKIENRIMKKLEGLPEIVTDYYNSMFQKTPHTKECYISYVSDFLNYTGKDYHNISLVDVNRYAQHLRYRLDKNGKRVENSVSTRRSKMFGISNFFDFLVKIKEIEYNPCIDVEMPAIKSDIEVISMDQTEIQKLKDNIETTEKNQIMKARDMAIVSLGITTGLRVSAISEINMEDLDMETKSITVTEKGNVVRTVYFGNKTKECLEWWITKRKEKKTSSDALFISAKGNRLSTDGIYRLIRKYTADFDKHITPHKMRSTCATNLYEKTHDIYMVQAVLGHKNIANTRRYANVSVKERRNAAEILDAI